MPALKVTISAGTLSELQTQAEGMGCKTENEMAALWLTLAAKIPARKQFEALAALSEYTPKPRPGLAPRNP